jgi:hypothetical protein
MGFLTMSRSWSSPSKESTDTPRSKEEEQALDILDAMEMGLAREMVADFVEPLPDASRLWKFQVDRSENRREYRLYCGDGEFLLYAKVSKDCRSVDIFQYDPLDKRTASFGMQRPAFTLQYCSSRAEWTLYQEGCDTCRSAPRDVVCTCRGRHEVLRARHTDADIGGGINHSMDVFAPSPDGLVEEHKFATKMPSWNEKLGCLVLDFKGRKIQASAKNFQLKAAGDETKRIVCQYGKIGQSSFGLDFRYPLTVSQAFGLCLTTLLWT